MGRSKSINPFTHPEEATTASVNEMFDRTAKSANTEEDALAQQISKLWFSHGTRNNVIRCQRKEQVIIRQHLSKGLYQYKSLLVGKGRGGQWLAFLRENNIPRSTADRYVKEWERKLAPQEANCPTEAITAPTQEQILQLVKQVKPKLTRVLTTQESVVQFMSHLAEVLGEKTSTSALDGCVINDPSTALTELTCTS